MEADLAGPDMPTDATSVGICILVRPNDAPPLPLHPLDELVDGWAAVALQTVDYGDPRSDPKTVEQETEGQGIRAVRGSGRGH